MWPVVLALCVLGLAACAPRLEPPPPSPKPARLEPPPPSPKPSQPSPSRDGWRSGRERVADMPDEDLEPVAPIGPMGDAMLPRRPQPPREAPPAGQPPSPEAPLPKPPAPEPPPLPVARDRAPGTPYDPAHPCFTVGQVRRVAAVLFRDVTPPRHEAWLRALNGAFHHLDAPCGDADFVVLVLTTIQLESGVRVDPPLENTNLEELFDYRLERLRDDNFLAGKVLDTAGLAEALRRKLRRDTRRGRVRTEADLVRYVERDLRAWLAGHLQERYYLPEPVARYAAENAVSNPVRTIGPMQVNLDKAARNARERGEPVGSPEAMRRLLLAPDTALERGLTEGIHQLWRAYRYYRRSLPARAAVRYAAADYNAGEFSSRNAAFQERVSRLSGHDLALDGDLLLYDDGRPVQRVSNTEAAVITAGAGLSPSQIRADLLLEKDERFTATRTARRICASYERRIGAPCRPARLPSGAQNRVARVKHGRTFTPAQYAEAYLRRWADNRRRYAAGGP